MIRVLEHRKPVRSWPRMIRKGNGMEFISCKRDHWCKANKITLAYRQPGEPTQKVCVEHFNGSMRREMLIASVFRTLSEVEKPKMDARPQRSRTTQSACSRDTSARSTLNNALGSLVIIGLSAGVAPRNRSTNSGSTFRYPTRSRGRSSYALVLGQIRLDRRDEQLRISGQWS